MNIDKKFADKNNYQELVWAALRQRKDELSQILRAGLKPVEEVLISVQLLPTLALQGLQTSRQSGRIAAAWNRKKLFSKTVLCDCKQLFKSTFRNFWWIIINYTGFINANIFLSFITQWYVCLNFKYPITRPISFMCESVSGRVRKVFVRLFPREQQPVVSHDLVEVDPVLDQQSDLDVHRVQVLLQGLIVPDQLGDLRKKKYNDKIYFSNRNHPRLFVAKAKNENHKIPMTIFQTNIRSTHEPNVRF